MTDWTEEVLEPSKKAWVKPEIVDLDQDANDIENGNPPSTTADFTFAAGS